MRKRIIGFIVAIVVIVAAVVGYNLSNQRKTATESSSSNQSTTKVSKNSSKKNGKTLIVYFSRTKGVYGGDLKKGNTKVMADYIQKHTGADEYEIVPAKDYPNGYQATADQAQKEQEDNARPKIKNALPNLSKYDTVFIGSPIWWGEYPMIIRTFMDKVDLNGKNVIPFTTHQGSGLGNTQEQLEKQYPKANVLKGLGVEGDQVNKSQGTVDKWLNGIGY